MLQNGIVKQIHKNTAEVEIQRRTACGESCASCGLCEGRTAVVSAANEINAAVGDRVMIDMSDKKILSAAFLVYIVPLITLFIGYFIGYVIFKSELTSAAVGFALMAVAFAVIVLFDKKLKERYTPKIVSIVSNERI